MVTGTYHSCALVSGRIYCWGSNIYGQLGDGATSADGTRVPVQVAGIANATTVAGGGNTNCAVVGGDAWCWGDGSYGLLGNNTTASSGVPVKVVFGL